jgi:prepilin peptidase CpaA
MLTVVTTNDMIGVCLLLAAGLHDIAARSVSNTLIVALATCATLGAVAHGHLATSILLSVFVFAAAVILWLRGFIGGGDAKLFGVAALLVPPAVIPAMLLDTAMIGGVLAIPYLIGPRLVARVSPQRPSGKLARIVRCEQWRLRRRGPLPYAVAIAAGTILSIVQGT